MAQSPYASGFDGRQPGCFAFSSLLFHKKDVSKLSGG